MPIMKKQNVSKQSVLLTFCFGVQSAHTCPYIRGHIWCTNLRNAVCIMHLCNMFYGLAAPFISSMVRRVGLSADRINPPVPSVTRPVAAHCVPR